MEKIKIEQLSVAYQDKQVLKQLTLTIPANKITAIIGPSGCGKTTLLQSMNGMVADAKQAKVQGNIYLNGKDIRQIPSDELKRRVGLVFQTPAPFPFSIYKNMTYAPKYYGIHDKQNLKEIVEEKLKMAGLYEEVKDNLNKNARKLSGGQQQRLCIARALTADPEVLLLDEPCSALDIQSTDIIEKMLTKLKENYTIVLVTHNIQQARRIADYTMFLQDGELVEYGETEELFTCPKEEKTRKFLM